MAALPKGVTCSKVSAMGITGYVVKLCDGKSIGCGGNAQRAWEDAHSWALRNLPQTSN